MSQFEKDVFRETAVSPQKETWRLALYIRLSRDDGNEESLSVSNQRKILMEYVDRRFSDTYTLEGVYVDDGQSGTDAHRPAFQRMIRDVEEGKVNCILCKNLSRAFRNYADQGYFLEYFFPRFHTRLIALSDPPVDTLLHPEAVTGLEVPINGLMNDRYAYKTSSDVRKTFDTKRRRGEFIGAFAPYGYRKDPENKNRLLPDPEAAKVVQSIFHWYVYGDTAEPDSTGSQQPSGGMSKEGIARRLNELGILNPTAYKKRQGLKYQNPQTSPNDGLWQGSSVKTILSNEMYMGTMVQGKQRVISYKVHERTAVSCEEWYRVPHTHEPIVDRELFLLAQERQKCSTRSVPGTGRTHLFSGLLRCADCHKAMTRRASKGFVYFSCSTYKRKSKKKCTPHSIRLDVLEMAVLTVIQKQIALVGHITRLLDRIQQAPTALTGPRNLEATLRQHKQEWEQTERRITGLYLDWKNGDLTRDQYRRLKDAFEAQGEQLQRAIRHIQEELAAQKPDTQQESPYLRCFLKQRNISSLSQGLLTELVEEIQVHDNGGITIRFRFADPYRQAALLKSRS